MAQSALRPEKNSGCGTRSVQRRVVGARYVFDAFVKM